MLFKHFNKLFRISLSATQHHNAVSVAGGDQLAHHNVASSPPPPQHHPHTNIWSFELIYPFGDQRSNQCNQSNNAWRTLSAVAAARGITILITCLCGVDRQLWGAGWGVEGGCFIALSFFSVPMHLFVYPYTRHTCTHCGPSVHKARRLAPARPSPLCFPATSSKQQGNMMEAFTAPVTRRRPPGLPPRCEESDKVPQPFNGPFQKRLDDVTRPTPSTQRTASSLPTTAQRHDIVRNFFFPLEKNGRVHGGGMKWALYPWVAAALVKLGG